MPTLQWIGKDKVINHHLDVPLRVLDKTYSFGAAENDGENKIIHGDNLEALKALLPEYEGRVSCVYIDPPYNTGNEGWIYNDNVNDPRIAKWIGEVVGTEGEDLSRHDKWLCMMYPRLRLLQKLLADDGVIFISIDSSELGNLRLLCDEIFGASNFVDSISWFKKASPSNDAQFFSNDVEYLMIYAQRKSIWRPRRLPLNTKQRKNYQNPDNDPRGPWNSATCTCNKTRDQRPNLYYSITNPNTGDEVWPSETAVWKWTEDTALELAREGRLYWGVNGDAKMPRVKKFLSEHSGVVGRTLWHYDDVGHTQGATQELKDLFDGRSPFDTPKPTRLIERILQIATGKDAIVLDSFAGSGTTAHAVLNANKADGGNRRFILVEMMDYAESITAERVRRVIGGYGEGKKTVEGTGGSFSYYELGEPMFKEDGNLNEAVGVERIRAYVWYSETGRAYAAGASDHLYHLGNSNGTGYYFYYEPDGVTTLDYGFLATIADKQDGYVIYADMCAISDDELSEFGIAFKKIPRDIARL